MILNWIEYICFEQVSCEYTTYESTLTDNATLPCPCQTRFSSLSKLNEKEIIWANGIIAKSKRKRFLFANNSIIIRNVSMSDSGVYVWVCDRDYVETPVQLVVRSETIFIFLILVIFAILYLLQRKVKICVQFQLKFKCVSYAVLVVGLVCFTILYRTAPFSFLRDLLTNCLNSLYWLIQFCLKRFAEPIEDRHP